MTGARRTHAELSERLPIIAMWADILHKTLVVATVSFSVWASCEVMGGLVGPGTEWLFKMAETYCDEQGLMGAG